MKQEIDQLLEDWIVLDRAIEEIRDAMSRHRNSVLISLIRICGSHTWNERRTINQALWRHRVHVFGYTDGVVRYKLRSVECTREIDAQEIVAGVGRYMERVERILTKAVGLN